MKTDTQMKNNIDNLKKDKTIDVIIPVYRAEKSFAELIRRLQKQKKAVSRIIIMHTEDGTDYSELSEQYDNVEIYSVDQKEYDHGGTRDKGIRLSDADIVVCLTQDAMPVDGNLTQQLSEMLEQHDVAAAYARQLPKVDCSLLERYTRNFNYPNESRVKSLNDLECLGIKTYFCSNVCAAYKREIYIEYDGFEKRTIFNEDMIFAAKLMYKGFKVAYCAEAKVIHSHNYSGSQQFKRNFDLGVSQSEHPEIFKNVKSENEGIRLIKKTTCYLIKAGHPFLIVVLLTNSLAKYGGYKLGLKYKKLPRWLVYKCTMNPTYWGRI